MKSCHFISLLLVFSATVLSVSADSIPTATDSVPVAVAPRRSKVPPVVHSAVGDSSVGVEGSLRIYNVGKRQQYSCGDKATFDKDVFSPKSVAFSSDGATFFVNSLEGCRTVAYDAKTLEKRYVVNYKYDGRDSSLWAPGSGYYTFTHYPGGERRAFSGKPVEMALSHEGRYLWVPFYRRTFDINAQDPSAIAVVDTREGRIVRMFETGPLPKMVAVNGDDTRVAVTHWGDNTVGLIDISSPDITRWHHLPPVTVGHKLKLDFPLDRAVNRDAKSGFLLRGTVFTPDGRYLLVSAMGGPLAVIDVAEARHVGMSSNLYGIRHLVIDRGHVYGSCNVAGRVVSFALDSLVAGVERAKAVGTKLFTVNGVRSVKVGGGARTLEVSPDGLYSFVACNSVSRVYVVNNERMAVVDTIRVDSYPVGLALSPDGRTMVVTSQGRDHNGGNAVNIFRIARPDLPAEPTLTAPSDTLAPTGVPDKSDVSDTSDGRLSPILLIAGAVVIAIILILAFVRRRK